MKQNGQGKCMYRFFLVFVVAIALSGIISCMPGMGEEIDLQAPTLTITSHKNLDYVGKKLVLAGTCSDNRGVKRIDVVNLGSGVQYSGVGINGTTWSIELSLPEGEQNIKVTAYDENNNSSNESVKQVTLLVDATDPFMSSLEILRTSGYTAPLISLQTLKELDSEKSTNMDFFQNEAFSLRGAVVENFVVNSVSLSLYDEAGVLVTTKSTDTGVSLRSPVFTITHAELVALNPAYSTGRHYFRVATTAVDAGNSNTDNFLWLCWYPQADSPRLLQTTAVENRLTLPKDSSIPLSFYDDDALSEVYVKVFSLNDWNTLSGSSTEEKLSNLYANPSLVSSNLLPLATRNWATSINAGSINGTYRIVILAKDAKEGALTNGVWASRMIELSVVDQDAPLPVIQSPQENTFPALSSGSKFTFSGYVLDNTGIESMSLAWIPSSITGGPNSRISEAETLLKSSTISMGSMATDSSGIKIWNVNLGTGIEETISSGDFSRIFSKRPFSHTFDVLTDFVFNSAIENDVKVFVLRCIDIDGNEVFQTYRLQGDTTSPVLTTIPANDLQVYGLSNDLSLSVSASKTNGLAIQSFEIQDITNAASPSVLTLSGTGSTRTVTVPVTSLAEGRRTYQFKATDVFGKTTTMQRTVILTSLPVLNQITSGQIDGLYKAGDTLLIQAIFSKPVKVSGTPLLDLRFSASDTVPKHASYASGSGTNTLVFSYTVPSGASSVKVHSAPAPISLNGGSIQTTEGSGGDAVISGLGGIASLSDTASLQGSKAISLDGIAPTITAISSNPATDSLREGEKFSITLTTSEPVFVSGSPKVILEGGSIQGNFQTIGSSSITFEYTIQSGDDTTGNLSYAFASCIGASDLSLIKDSAGNALSLSNTAAGDLGMRIDTIAPGAPTMNLTSGNYNGSQTLILSNLEALSSSFYSLNGGITWTTYSAPVSIGNGTHSLTSYQTDAAGNTSNVAPSVSLVIQNAFPNLTALSCEQPDGVYKTGAVLTFKLAFSELVKTSGAGSSVTLAGSHTASIVEESVGSKVLYFTYTVPAGITMDPVTVTAMNLSTVQDMFGNTTAVTVPPSFSRANLKVDSVAPAFSSFAPANAGVLALDGKGNSVITFTMAENVFIESGVITVRRKGEWLVPPVLTEEEFQKVYYSSALNATDRNNLMNTTGGLPTLDPISAQAVGPYIKTTHGLISGSGAPDTSTKYVLAFTKDITDATLRGVFEKTGYHQQTVDVSSYRVVVSDKTVTVTLPTPLPPGREWEVFVSAAAFRDSAGNVSPLLDFAAYSFWSQKVATPVIRVERYSYGSTMQEKSGSPGEYVVAPAPTTVGAAPTGKVRVRIDCETPGAAITYGIKDDINKLVASATTQLTAQADAGPSDLTAMPTLNSYTTSATFEAGDGSYDTAQKIYIAATATKADLTDSDRGYEGAFKTVVVYWNPGDPGNPAQQNALVLQGSTVQGGMPTISGFPLRDADPDNRYSKYFYKKSTTEFYWNTWEIVSSWAMQGKYGFPGGNWQQGYNNGNYGQVTSRDGQGYW